MPQVAAQLECDERGQELRTARRACPSRLCGSQDLELNVDKAKVDMDGDVVYGARAWGLSFPFLSPRALPNKPG